MSPRSGRAAAAASLWAPVALYAAGVSYLSHQPTLPVPYHPPDWLLHGVEFAGLAALVVRALGAWPGGLAPPAAAVVLTGCAVFGVLDEAHQSFVPGRHASARDVAADTVGSGLVVAAATLRRATRRAGGAGAIEVTLYGRHGCHLCVEAEAALARAAARFPIRVTKVDVDGDAGLEKRYGHELPVVAIDGRRWSKLGLDERRLHRKLEGLARERSA